MLAALQVDRILASRTVKGIKSALTSMPYGLDELYRQTLGRIQNQADDDGPLGMGILSWITHARRLLSVNELRHGLATEYSDNEEDPEGFDEDNLLSPESLVDVCAGLVVIDTAGQIIRLVHFTTQEYFDKTRLHLFNGTEVDVARVCLTYLSYALGPESKKERIITMFKMESVIALKDIGKHPFLDYASHYWFSHVSCCLLAEHPDPAFTTIVARFKSTNGLSFSTHLLAMLSPNLWWYKAAIEEPESRGISMTPLDIAFKLGYEELATVLLDHSTGTCLVSESSLVSASSKGFLDIVKLLLKIEAPIDSTISSKRSILTPNWTKNALRAACLGGHVSTVEVLIEKGPDINGRGVMPPLHSAASYNHTIVVDLLLKNGANVNARDTIKQTACHVAATYGCIASVRCLLDAGCDLELTDDFGRTALYCAAERAHPDVIELLLDRGSNAFAKDMEGKTARIMLEDRLSRTNSTSGNTRPRYDLWPWANREDLELVTQRLLQVEKRVSTSGTNHPKVE